MRLASLLALLLLAPAGHDPSLQGTWLLEGAPYLTLSANGTGTLSGEPLRWASDGLNLTLDSNGEQRTVPYRLDRDVLRLAAGGESLVLVREGSASAKGPRWSAGQDPLSKLLLHGPWCLRELPPGDVEDGSMPERIAFLADGTFRASVQIDGEPQDTHGLWRTRGQVLLVSDGQRPFVAIPVQASSRSGKVAGLRAGGALYAHCRR